jgi:hypothetical protein
VFIHIGKRDNVSCVCVCVCVCERERERERRGCVCQLLSVLVVLHFYFYLVQVIISYSVVAETVKLFTLVISPMPLKASVFVAVRHLALV